VLIKIAAVINAVCADRVNQPAGVGVLNDERFAAEGVNRRLFRQAQFVESGGLAVVLLGEMLEVAVNPQRSGKSRIAVGGADGRFEGGEKQVGQHAVSG